MNKKTKSKRGYGKSAQPDDKKPGCQWPTGEPGTKDFHFCGEPVRENSRQPYCEAHWKKANSGIYNPKTGRIVMIPNS